jgi:hypothetical protein
MEEFDLQSIIETAVGTDSRGKEILAKHTRGAARWYYDETDYDAHMDLTSIFSDEA